MVVDDARVIDAGSCQLETWRRNNRDSKETWALPGCNPTGNLELTLGSAELPVDDLGLRSTTRTVQMQGKTLFRNLETNSYSYGLAAGGVVRSRGAADQVPNYYAYLPLTRSLLDDRWFVHANLGVQRAGANPQNGMTYGIGTEYEIIPRVFAMVETYGDNHQRNSYQGGVRAWIVPNRVQSDGRYHRRRLRRQSLVLHRVASAVAVVSEIAAIGGNVGVLPLKMPCQNIPITSNSHPISFSMRLKPAACAATGASTR